MDQTTQAEGPMNAAYDPRAIGGTKLAERKPGAMVMQLEEQNMLTNQLGERLEVLFERIRPVWQSPSQKMDGGTEPDRPELPVQIEQVSMHNRRIRQALQAVNLMIDGLEV